MQEMGSYLRIRLCCKKVALELFCGETIMAVCSDKAEDTMVGNGIVGKVCGRIITSNSQFFCICNLL